MTTEIKISDEGYFVQEVLNSRDAELQSLRQSNLKLSREVGILNGVVQGVIHWDIPKELKVKLESELRKSESFTELQSLRRDKERLDWIESKQTLHTTVEFLYVVDGIEVQESRDANFIGKPYHGATLRDAIDSAMSGKEGK